MRLINSIHLNVFIKEEEDSAKIAEVMRALIHLNLEKEKLSTKKQSATGFNEKKIVILAITLEKERHLKAFMDHLFLNLGDRQKELLVRQADSRLDEELNFFLRLDKDRLLSGEYWITDSGNCFHLKINIAAFPRKRELALDLVKKIFS